LAKIIAELEKISWKISINTDIGKQNTNSCIFFRKVVVLDQGKREKLSRDGDIFIFSPSGMGSILLIDVPQNIERDLVDSIGATCSMENYKLLETIDGVILTSRLNLKGFSWCSTGDQAIAVRKMILKVIQTARQYKYELVTNLNVKGTTDSLLFQHKRSLQASPEDMMMISLNRNDRLRLISSPTYVMTAVEEVVSQHWGLQNCKEKEGCWEFKLYGTPWWADGEDSVKARYLIAQIIIKLKALGWEVAATLDVSRKLNDKTVFVFRQSPPETQPFAVLSFHQSDKLRFMSSSDNVLMLTDGIDRILDAADLTSAISFYWKAKQWKLKGVPFSGSTVRGADQRMIIHQLTRILKHFHSLGWRLVASADVSAKYYKNNNSNEEYPLDTHSWFFLHDPDSMIVSDTVITMEPPPESGSESGDLCLEQDTVLEIRKEKTKGRYFLRVILPFAFILGVLLYYVLLIIGVV